MATPTAPTPTAPTARPVRTITILRRQCPRCRRRKRRPQHRLTIANGDGWTWRHMRVSRRYGTAMLPVRLMRRAGIQPGDEIVLVVVRPGLLAVQLVRRGTP